MGFSYRKSLKMGPFRVTASKSGISYSAGVKGVRVTKRANGKVQTTLSVPGSGLRYTTTSGKGKASTKRPAASASSAARRAVPPPKPVSRPSAAPTPARVPYQPRPANPPRTRKPVRLRGRRSSVQPRIAAPWLLPFAIKGYLATVTVHQGGIHIERTHAGKINGSQSTDIPWHELAGIDCLDPNFFRSGHVHFATPDDPRGLTSTGNGNRMAASARNPHAILFTWQQSRAYRQLRDLLSGNPPVPPPSQPSAYPAPRQ